MCSGMGRSWPTGKKTCMAASLRIPRAMLDPEMYDTTTMMDYTRKPIDLERGSSNVESLPYDMLFGHGRMEMGDTKASNAEASMMEIQYTKPTWEKRAAHAMAWVGEKDNDLTMPAIADPRRHLLEDKKKKWNHEVSFNVHKTSMSHDQYRNPTEQPLQHFKSEPRKPRANYLGKTLGAVHLAMG